jgi:hypothetical protein
MPKENIDYSNTIIYKIYCIDETIKDIYVGHTTHFIQRKYQHKLLCNNLKNVLKIYKIIRENGGWDNWNMVEIAKYNCNDSTEARIKEQLHYEELNASLNSCPPYVDKIQYYCFECELQCSGPTQFNNHINCISHIKKQINPNNEQTIINKSNFCPKFMCQICDYSTSHKCNYDKHIVTPKHISAIKVNDNVVKCSKPKSNHICSNCNKEYKVYSGLWRHKKKCGIIQCKEDLNDQKKQQQLVDYLIKENSEFKQLIIEQNKHMIDQNKHMLELAKNAGNQY